MSSCLWDNGSIYRIERRKVPSVELRLQQGQLDVPGLATLWYCNSVVLCVLPGRASRRLCASGNDHSAIVGDTSEYAVAENIRPDQWA